MSLRGEPLKVLMDSQLWADSVTAKYISHYDALYEVAFTPNATDNSVNTVRDKTRLYFEANAAYNPNKNDYITVCIFFRITVTDNFPQGWGFQ
eukprot:1014305-Amphidinium_carterae.1